MNREELEAFYAETRKLVPKSARNPALNGIFPTASTDERPPVPKPAPPRPKRRKRHLLGYLTLGIIGGVVGGATDGLIQLGELDAKDPK